jgi:hypothetical protein
VVPDADTPAGLPVELSHCPHCRGAVRADAPWCTQCWADLRPAPEPVVEAPAPVVEAATPSSAAFELPTQTPSSAAFELPTQPDGTAPSRPVGGWPCGICGHVNSVAQLDSCVGCGAGFLAAMRSAEEPLLVLPGVGDVTQLSRAQRIGIGAAAAVAVVLVVMLLGLLLG